MIASDFRYAIRGLVRRPALAVVTIVTLTIGIAVNAIMFGVVDQLMLRPPALVKQPDRVRRIFLREYAQGKLEGSATNSYRFFDVLRRVPAFSDVAVYTSHEMTMGRGAGAERLGGMAVTYNFFHLLGVPAALGRAFVADEDLPPQGPRVVILSDGLWHRLFGGARDVIGKSLILDDRAFTIVGVMPPGFTGADRIPTDVWVPMSAVMAETMGQNWAMTPNSFWTEGIARVRENASFTLAEREATTIYRGELRSWNQPWRDSTGVIALGSLAPGSTATGLSPEARVAAWLLGVSAIVLLIACANVANMLIARAMERRREIAVRLALGASQWQLLRQLLIDATVLAIVATVFALAAAPLGGRIVERILLPGTFWDAHVLDNRVLLFTLLIVVVCILVAGLSPALQISRQRVHEGLSASSPRIAGSGGRIRALLLAAQVALSLILLVGAGLFVRSLRNVSHRDVGVDIDKVVLVMPPRRRGATDREIGEWYREAYPRVAALPGVERIAVVGQTVPGRMAAAFGIDVPGHRRVDFPGGGPYSAIASSDYFATMGTKILRGRSFSPEEEHSPSRVVIVNQIVADAYWPGQDPVGQCAKITGDTQCSTVVGVVENMLLFKLVRDDRAAIYVPWTHPSFANALASAMVVRSRTTGEELERPLHALLKSISPAGSYVPIEPYTQIVALEMQPWRLGAAMFSIFGLLATIIAAVGLYSVMAYWASQRTHEIGVRMALGAQRVDVVRLLATHAAATVGAGLVIGAVVALFISRWIADLLFETSTSEPAVYLSAAATLGIAAVLATLVPARRVSSVDPAIALRND